jgi:L-fuculose-phosphate aldolase
MELLTEDKTTLLRSEREKMQVTLPRSAWSEREKLALACRILCRNGHESGLAGQVTARAGSGELYTQRLGYGLGEARASELLRVSPELSVLEGSGMPNPANRFHAWVYRARPDAQCIVHTHPPHSSALSMLGVPLLVAHMDSCALYDNVGFLARWPGVPVGDEEGRLISGALGDKSAALLAHHGIVVVGRSVEEACVLALQFERAAQLQLLAAGAGTIGTLPREPALEARDWLLGARRMEATFAAHARVVLAKEPECLR